MATKAPTAKAAPKKASAAKTPKLAVVGEETAEEANAKDAPALKIKEMVDRVIATSGVSNRKNVRLVIDATLNELVKALQAGEAPHLPGVGRMRVQSQRNDETSGLHMTLKLRRPVAKPSAQKDEKEALAEAGEDS